MFSPIESDEDVPDIVPGEVVHTDNGDLAYKVLKQIGTGRCCVVYSGSAVRDGSMVALKFFRRGSNYEGAVQRERYILDTFNEPQHNIVSCYAYLTYRGMHCLVLELLDVNIRQIIFKNNRHGLSPWATFKFARDLLTSLQSLHQAGFVHADLKPANVLWSGQDGVFKCIDFGLSFSMEEEDIHQIQSSGYRSPEATTWNLHKEDQKWKRKRKLEGTFLHLNYICSPLLSREHQADDSQSPSIITDDKRKESLFECFNPEDVISVDESYTKDNCEENEILNNKRAENKDLHHSDSHSSGIFSQEGSERSRCSSRLSWDGDIELKTRSKFARNTENHNKIDDECQKEESSNLVTAKFNPSNIVTATSSQGNISVNEEELDKFDEKDIQDWRKTRGKSVVHDRRIPPPSQPSAASDIWSVGCLITEALTGRKLFQTGDKLASVLRPSQLLEMKVGETEVAWTEAGHEQMFTQLKDLILNCIKEDPSSRISADEALNHPIFKLNPAPSMDDLSILPSPILQFSRCSEIDTHNVISEDMLETLKTECEAYGEIMECRVAASGLAFVHFHEVRQAVFAKLCFLNLLTKEDENECVQDISYFNNQDVGAFNKFEWIVTFFPLDLWSQLDQ